MTKLLNWKANQLQIYPKSGLFTKLVKPSTFSTLRTSLTMHHFQSYDSQKLSIIRVQRRMVSRVCVLIMTSPTSIHIV
jgi:hypothetical protein